MVTTGICSSRSVSRDEVKARWTLATQACEAAGKLFEGQSPRSNVIFDDCDHLATISALNSRHKIVKPFAEQTSSTFRAHPEVFETVNPPTGVSEAHFRLIFLVQRALQMPPEHRIILFMLRRDLC